jgi:ABC-type uncharacterized transport system substrate-binding protein
MTELFIDTRRASTDATEIRRQAEELAALAPDVILAGSHSSAAPLLQATRTVPIVFEVNPINMRDDRGEPERND